MSKRKKKQVYLPHIAATAAAGECTGLMPTPPRTEAQQRSYQALYSTSLPREEE